MLIHATKLIASAQKGIYVSYVWEKLAPAQSKSPYLCRNWVAQKDKIVNMR